MKTTRCIVCGKPARYGFNRCTPCINMTGYIALGEGISTKEAVKILLEQKRKEHEDEKKSDSPTGR